MKNLILLLAAVSAITWRSYCFQIQDLEAMSGEDISFSSTSPI